ncbi:MAG: D-glycero-beta-D-manno-heptose 1-phosphate adenylyltransferase [Candidatus Sumerlaeota bacterium]|nr:D-glycero-beta-D-manno-heptose 1-phosphate adenylyltransferase [Candidatus Sumerlaeota bacterium]
MTEDRILHTYDAAAEWADKHRAAGRTVVFTNGVFDLLHNGHLDSLRKCRAEGDVLIVGLNDDDSVRRLKGPGRPILPLDQRLRLVASLHCVDAVVAFSEDTPARIIEAVAPNVLVKGGHYTIPEIVGHEFVLDRGGRVLSLPLLPGCSTSSLVDRVKERFAPGRS